MLWSADAGLGNEDGVTLIGLAESMGDELLAAFLYQSEVYCAM